MTSREMCSKISNMETKLNFQIQSEAFLKAIQTRRRHPVKPGTAAKYTSSLSHALPLLGNRDLSQVGNGEMKVLVEKLSLEGFSASTITGVVAVVKLVVASAVNANGDQLYPRTWNNEFMDLPVIDPRLQKAPVATSESITEAITQALSPDKALYALLAGTGLRKGEALALMASDWNREEMTVSVTKTLTSSGIGTTKTDAGDRIVDLTPELNNFLIKNIGTVKGRLFPDNPVKVWRHMEKNGLLDGAHTLRRFRVTQLRKSAVPEGLVKYWIGHADESITDRYDKIKEDLIARREFVRKAGLGFQLGA